jgi:hypothetical protein
MTVLLMFLLSIALLLALLWLIFGRRTPKTDLAAAALEIKKLLPVHCSHFPQICGILKDEDEQFMRRRASGDITKQWRAQRRQILRFYIQGLAQDFRGLERLARLIAALSPEVKRRQEWKWLWLGVQFRLLYRVTLLRLAVHRLEPNGLATLTEMVADLGLTLGRWIDRLTEALPQARTSTAN